MYPLSKILAHLAVKGVASSPGSENADKLIKLDSTGNLAVEFIPVGSIDHTELLNIGTNTHAQIDTHIADVTKHRVINDSTTTTTSLWSSSKISSDLGGKVNTSAVGAVNGIATLGSDQKLTTSQIPAALIGGVNYQGTWNASTNTPSLSDGTSTKGFYYVVSTGATRNLGSGNIVFNVSDWVVYNGTIWEKVDNTDSVTSVAGKTGAVTLVNADITDLGSRSVGGDLSGTIAATTVTKIQGRNVSNTAPTNGQTLTWSAANSQYEPAAGGGAGVPYFGTATLENGSPASPATGSIDFSTVAAGDGTVMTFVGYNSTNFDVYFGNTDPGGYDLFISHTDSYTAQAVTFYSYVNTSWTSDWTWFDNGSGAVNFESTFAGSAANYTINVNGSLFAAGSGSDSAPAAEAIEIIPSVSGKVFIPFYVFAEKDDTSSWGNGVFLAKSTNGVDTSKTMFEVTGINSALDKMCNMVTAGINSAGFDAWDVSNCFGRPGEGVYMYRTGSTFGRSITITVGGLYV